MSRKHDLIRGASVLTAAGLICRGAGFFFRIFLSRAFREEGVGIYQLIFPVYALCFAFCASGVQLAVSRAVAKRTALEKDGEPGRILFYGLCFSVSLSFICFFFLQKKAGAVATGFLGDTRCEPLLVLIAYALPFGAAHSCITGYCYGKQEVNIPAFSQLIEQASKILFVVLTFYILKPRLVHVPVEIAAAGLVTGEICSCAYAFYFLNKKERSLFSLKTKKENHVLYIKELLGISVPVSCSRVLITFLQSVEAVSIPTRLRMYGMSGGDALKIYGVLAGMALPCIFLPAVITNSLSSLLMPAVAKIQISPDRTSLRGLIKKVSFSCLALGILCCLFFRMFGRHIGSFLFHSAMAGEFISALAWICPFFYIDSVLISIINGLGKAPAAFFINAAGLVIRILNVFFAIPAIGINGYFLGLLSSQLTVSVLSAAVIVRLTDQKIIS